MSRRDQIAMTSEEIDTFLQRRQTVSLASIDPKGKIHLVAMWYGFYQGQVAMWTYGKSQKIVNLRSNPNVTMLIEDGDRYEELRGVEIVGTARVIEDRPSIEAIGASIFDRYVSPDIDGDVAVLREGFVKSAQKRLGIVVDVEKIVSWDHRKLQGVY
ncbi:MAG: pyridoxamine 5'-phosphate oxidase family protein [Actinomycetota bacterium]|nr:pyridoxamine 5'-phosphate oxidase family protein [Actinomycetota bacterium]